MAFRSTQMRKQLLGEQSACKLSCVGTREKSQLLLGLAPMPCLVGRGLRQNHTGEEFVPKRDTYLIPSHIPSCLLKDIGPEPPSLQHHRFSSCLIIPVSPQTKNRHTQHHLVNLSTPLVTVLVLFPPPWLSLWKKLSRPPFQPSLLLYSCSLFTPLGLMHAGPDKAPSLLLDTHSALAHE